MAPAAERPPSERGPEWRALDAIEDLTRKVDDLAKRPTIAVPGHGNWWDVLPRWQGYGPGPGRSFADLFSESAHFVLGQLPMRDPSFVACVRASMYPDRLELSLQLNGGWIVWQRALFYEPRAA